MRIAFYTPRVSAPYYRPHEDVSAAPLPLPGMPPADVPGVGRRRGLMFDGRSLAPPCPLMSGPAVTEGR
jgi:hypothetical protein